MDYLYRLFDQPINLTYIFSLWYEKASEPILNTLHILCLIHVLQEPVTIKLKFPLSPK